MYDAYSFAVIPRIGGLVAGDADSYQYLVESIRQFPDQVREQTTLFFGSAVAQEAWKGRFQASPRNWQTFACVDDWLLLENPHGRPA
jgi:hypothetical protein